MHDPFNSTCPQVSKTDPFQRWRITPRRYRTRRSHVTPLPSPCTAPEHRGPFPRRTYHGKSISPWYFLRGPPSEPGVPDHPISAGPFTKIAPRNIPVTAPTSIKQKLVARRSRLVYIYILLSSCISVSSPSFHVFAPFSFLFAVSLLVPTWFYLTSARYLINHRLSITIGEWWTRA